MMWQLKAERCGTQKMGLGEGPFWDWRSDTLGWVDITGCAVYLCRGGRCQRVETGQYVGAAVPAGREGYVLALASGFYRMDGTGLTQRIGAPADLPPRYRFNDAKCDSRGRLYAGTIGLYGDEGKQGALYCLENGTVKKRLSGLELPNGMDWDEGQGRFYFIDTPTGQVAAYRWDACTGALSDPHPVVKIREGVPDGMALDAQGRLWVAQWGGGRVGCYAADSGEKLGEVLLPASYVTSCCFGGERLDTLYITTAAAQGEEGGGYLYQARPGAVGRRLHPYGGN